MDLTDKKAFCDSKIKEWQGKRQAFCKETGLHKDGAREWIGERGKSNNKVANTGGGGTIQEQKTFNKIDEKRLDLEKVTKEGKEVLAKYASNMEAELDYDAKKTAYYSGKKIYLNIDKVEDDSKAFGYTKNMVAFLHEAGHWFDYNAREHIIHVELKDLRKLITQDVLKKCGEIMGETYKRVSELPNASLSGCCRNKLENNLLVDEDLKNGVLDIYAGATKNRIWIGYGHVKSYWKKLALESEAFANMFEAFASGGKKAEYMKEYLPTAFRYFLDFIKKM